MMDAHSGGDAGAAAGWMTPFLAVAQWLQRGLPATWRGLVVLGPDGDTHLPRQGAAVRVELPASAVLWREVDDPSGPSDRRAAMILSRLEALSPWATGAFFWAEGGLHGGRLRVALTAAAPLKVQSARLAEAGHRLTEVTTADGLWLVEDQPGRTRLARRLFAIWALALVVGLGLGAWGASRLTAAKDSADLATLRLEKLAAHASTMNDVSRAALALAGQKTDAASLSRALDRLAASLPADSWAETLRLTPQDFEISGRSAAPDAIIPALEGQGSFTGVDFAGASAHDATTGLYTFTLHGNLGVQP